MQNFSFKEKLQESEKNDRSAIPMLEGYLKEGIRYNEDLATQKEGIDFISESGKTIEMKIVGGNYYNDRFPKILLETQSSIEDCRDGWIYTCKADIFVYLWKWKGGRIIGGYAFNMPELKKWWLKNRKNQTNAKFAMTDNRYTTENYLVNLGDIPASIILAKL